MRKAFTDLNFTSLINTICLVINLLFMENLEVSLTWLHTKSPAYWGKSIGVSENEEGDVWEFWVFRGELDWYKGLGVFLLTCNS